jgi:hypothetical protein
MGHLEDTGQLEDGGQLVLKRHEVQVGHGETQHVVQEPALSDFGVETVVTRIAGVVLCRKDLLQTSTRTLAGLSSSVSRLSRSLFRLLEVEPSLNNHRLMISTSPPFPDSNSLARVTVWPEDWSPTPRSCQKVS